MTALAFVRVESRLLLLSGEGPYLHVYDGHTRLVECSSKVFDSEDIHGIKVRSEELCPDPDDARKQIVAWAGSSICLADVEGQTDIDGKSSIVIKVIAKSQTKDWIQDVCFRPVFNESSSTFDAVFLTSRNRLHGLNFSRGLPSHEPDLSTIQLIAAGPPSLLYCAHILWPAKGRGLIAAGNVFGTVFLWSFPDIQTLLRSSLPVCHSLHCTLVGHEGSVFGVRISEPSPAIGHELARRLVASCSDDRTIRVWDISGLDDTAQEHQLDNGSTSPARQVATVMGHKSRIWGVRFLRCNQGPSRVISYGEDGSLQVWRIDNLTRYLPQIPAHVGSTLYNEASYTFHTGKNIWAVDVLDSLASNSVIASGGADGRIVYYTLKSQGGRLGLDRLFFSQSTIIDVRLNVQTKVRTPDSNPQGPPFAGSSKLGTKVIFDGLKGDWVLVRALTSAIPAYPTGKLTGLATFQERSSTDPVYDLEYLYLEKGQFTTQQGITLSATRRYVYRYILGSNQISVWFVKPEDGLTVDYLFHTLEFPAVTPDAKYRTLKAHHLCNEDNYWAEYIFSCHASSLNSFSVKYVVKGPNKDYIADAIYTRQPAPRADAARVPSGNLEYNGVPQGIDDDINAPNRFESPISTNDSFKSYAWVDESSFLVTTDQGWLLLGSVEAKGSVENLSEAGISNKRSLIWTTILQDSAFRCSCILSNVESRGLVLITGQDGVVYCFRGATRTIALVTKLPRKVACLRASCLDLMPDSLRHDISRPGFSAFVSCLGTSTAYHLMISHENETFRCVQIQVDLPATFIPTSSLFVESQMILIIGFRNGALAFYHLSHNVSPGSPKLVKPYVHGRETVSAMKTTPLQHPSGTLGSICFVSAGRDGKYAVHLLDTCIAQESSAQMSLKTIHTCNLPFGPNIEGISFDRETQELLVWGFCGKLFVVWNDSLKVEVTSVECGGAHRNWAYLPLENTKGGGNLLFTKASSLNIFLQSQPSHKVLRYGGHGREIKAISLSPPIKGYNGPSSRYLATGAEDTTILVFNSTCKDELHVKDGQRLTVLSDHTTGIQKLRWSSDGRFLFSAAGREEFFVWQMQVVPCFGLGAICLSKCPRVTDSGDLRIMGFDIIDVLKGREMTTSYIVGAVYSNSSLRVSRSRQF